MKVELLSTLQEATAYAEMGTKTAYIFEIGGKCLVVTSYRKYKLLCDDGYKFRMAVEPFFKKPNKSKIYDSKQSN